MTHPNHNRNPTGKRPETEIKRIIFHQGVYLRPPQPNRRTKPWTIEETIHYEKCGRLIVTKEKETRAGPLKRLLRHLRKNDWKRNIE